MASPCQIMMNIHIRKIVFWSFIVFVSTMANPVRGSNSDLPVLVNSTVSCTRGDVRTLHQLSCDEDGTTGILAIRRLFYGTTPTSSGCSLKAPYEDCCRQDSDENCIFESDFKLDENAVKCSGKPKCRFYGQSVMTSRGGNCSSETFPSITSFSFMEYSCLSQDNLINVCPKEENSTEGVKLYLDSNHKHENEHLDSDDKCSCVLYSRCGARVVLEAILIQLRKINSTDCVEEITVQDLKDQTNSKTYSCLDHDTSLAISNKIMMTSTSNAVLLRLHIFEKHNGKILISATSSDPNSTLRMICGPDVSAKSLPSEYYCSGEVIPIFTEEITTKNPDGDLQTGKNDQMNEGEGGSDTVVVQKESEELHGGAIAGIVLAAVGILLVVSQVLYFLIRRHQKRIDHQREDRSFSCGSSLSPSQMINPTFVPDVVPGYDFDDDENHIYDLAMGTVRGRNSAVYNTYISQGVGDDGGCTNPEKDINDFMPGVGGRGDASSPYDNDDGDDDYEIVTDKAYTDPPTPYDNGP